MDILKNLISVAGYDPSGGAGVLLDLAIFQHLGHRGFGVLTAVTAQNPERVNRVFAVSARAVISQFDRLAEAFNVAGIKVGMLATAENLSAAARILARNPGIPRVVDPVFRSSSGIVLLEKAAWPRYLAVLRGKADLILPNIDEAEMLTGSRARTISEMRRVAEIVARAGRMACLLKGGHLQGPAADVLYDGGEFTVFEHQRLAKSVHGTGCFLSSAILGYMAGGRPLKEACGLGIARIGAAIRTAVPAGRGRWVFDLSRDQGWASSRGRKRH